MVNRAKWKEMQTELGRAFWKDAFSQTVWKHYPCQAFNAKAQLS